MDTVTQVLFGTVVFICLIAVAGAVVGLTLRTLKDHLKH